MGVRRRGAMRVATMMSRRAATATETVGLAEIQKRWTSETQRGFIKWEMWQETISPVMAMVRMDPELKPEQRQIAAKEVLRLFRDTFEDYLRSLYVRGKGVALRFEMAAPPPAA